MKSDKDSRRRSFAGLPHAALLGALLKWIWLGGLVGLAAGTASALFLTALGWATEMQRTHAWLMYLLPAGGAAVSWVYGKYGKESLQGNNLILAQIRRGDGRIPLRMAPLVLGGTIATHLFGGSAGREGTAVQMGGSLADWIARGVKADAADRRILLMCGIAAGFGSVFGTPLAGTVFALEVAVIGLVRYEALMPCFIAAYSGHLTTTRLWGVPHQHWSIGDVPAFSPGLLLKIVIASALFGLASLAFSELTHALKRGFARLIGNAAIRSAAGGLLIIGLVFAAGTRNYLGLGLPLLDEAFAVDGNVSPFAFLWKLVFTSVTLGAGFQGGEVTPLFVIGALLGHTLGGALDVSAPFLAALGMVAVFCGATNTPLACFILGVELFGAVGAEYWFIACLVSYLLSGHTGIYGAQRIGIPKSRRLQVPELSTLQSVRKGSGHSPEDGEMTDKRPPG